MTDEFFARRIAQRAKEIEDEFRQICRDAEHWNRTHPDEEPIVVEPITREEIEARARRDAGSAEPAKKDRAP